jgi:hypothetical protein
MKKIGILTIFFFMAFIRCSDVKADLQLDDLKEHNMKIIPEDPVSGDDIKLVVFDDCTYNILSGITRTGKIIDIQKTFNSMMKWPCVMKNDTIMIGKLPEGTYTVNYKLLDTSTQTTDPIALSFSFSLPVSR